MTYLWWGEGWKKHQYNHNFQIPSMLFSLRHRYKSHAKRFLTLELRSTEGGAPIPWGECTVFGSTLSCWQGKAPALRGELIRVQLALCWQSRSHVFSIPSVTGTERQKLLLPLLLYVRGMVWLHGFIELLGLKVLSLQAAQVSYPPCKVITGTSAMSKSSINVKYLSVISGPYMFPLF